MTKEVSCFDDAAFEWLKEYELAASSQHETKK